MPSAAHVLQKPKTNPFQGIPQGTPRYRLLQPFFAPDDTLYPEDTELAFDGTPNEFMEPLNAAAEAKLTEYLQMLDDGQRAVDEKHGRQFTGRLSDLADIFARVRDDTKAEVEAKARKAIVMPTKGENIPTRGDTVRAQAAKRAKSGIVAVKPPNVSRKQKTPQELIGITGRESVPDAIANNARDALGDD